jgi:uncharacterized protein
MGVSAIGGILQTFVSGTSDVQGAALVSPDGLPLASSLPGTMDVEKVMVEGNDGYGILMGCGDDAVLLVLASQSAKQGLLMLDIKRTVTEIKAALN